jgi:transposase, IS30 family
LLEGKNISGKKSALKIGIKNQRPAIVDEKRRLRDWEDTIIGKNQKQAIVILVERVSKKTVLSKVNAKKASLVSSSIISSVKLIADKFLTITADNGSEFAYHERISQELETDFYFVHTFFNTV